ncbi:hypothetical protein ACFOYW_17830, partial [Gryllotalpicola reticulitermitis]
MISPVTGSIISVVSITACSFQSGHPRNTGNQTVPLADELAWLTELAPFEIVAGAIGTAVAIATCIGFGWGWGCGMSIFWAVIGVLGPLAELPALEHSRRFPASALRFINRYGGFPAFLADTKDKVEEIFGI